MCFLGILTSSFEKVLFSSVAHFFIGSLIWGEFSILSSLYILVISSLSDVQSENMFSHSVGCLFNLRLFLLFCRSFLISCSPICLSFLLVAELLEFY
jgi:hypothetical protein